MLTNPSPQEDLIKILPNMNFTIVHKINTNPNTLTFKLHNHDDVYEIVLLISGNCEFEVEGNTYKLKPHDILFTRPFELHHIMCLSNKEYERIILYVKADYFIQNNCEEFLSIFENRELGTGNILSSDIIDGEERNCILRILKYYDAKQYKVANSAVMEFLYLLNKAKQVKDDFFTKNERIRDIIVYINNNISEDLCLDTISDKFYINKHYLCKSFKKNTGFTVNQYINYKRLLLAAELHRKGETLLQASMNAGFNSYAHFYKTFVKENGRPPKTIQ